MTDKNRGPRGRTGPGRGRGGAGRARAAALAAATEAAVQAKAKEESSRARLTSRAAILVLVVAVLTVSYASSLKAFLQQRTHINDLQSQITQTQADIDALEAEKRRWDDDAFVEQQARARLGYVMPGEKTYIVLDENGNAVQPASTLDDPTEVLNTESTPWWADAWESVELAGNPPKPAKPPAAEIDGSNEPTELE